MSEHKWIKTRSVLVVVSYTQIYSSTIDGNVEFVHS